MEEDIQVPEIPAKVRLMDKKTADLTVGDSLKLAVVVPMLSIAGSVAGVAVVGAVGSVIGRFRRNKTEDKDETKESDTTETE